MQDLTLPMISRRRVSAVRGCDVDDDVWDELSGCALKNVAASSLGGSCDCEEGNEVSLKNKRG